MSLFGTTFTTLEQALAYSSAKNRTIASNIANVDTPRYKSKDVTFKQTLNQAMKQPLYAKRTHEQHVPFDKNIHQPYQIVTKNHTSYNHNGNNVDIDKEMAALAQNQIFYQGLVDRMNGKFNSIQTVIREGR